MDTASSLTERVLPRDEVITSESLSRAVDHLVVCEGMTPSEARTALIEFMDVHGYALVDSD